MAAVTTSESHSEQAPHVIELSFAEKLRNNRLGLWLFCFSEAFLFIALLAARFYLWGNTRPGLDQTLGLITTAVLLLSSVCMAFAESAMGAGKRKHFLWLMLATFVLGLLFLVGVVGLEWRGELAPGDGAYGAVFFGMTGIHAIHVLTGLILIIIVWNNGRRGIYTEESHWAVEACAIYWHYVDVIWIFFYPALYLIGSAVHLG